VEFLDVGQGDAILIRSPEGKTALIDAGPSGHLVGLLRDRGIRSLDLVAVSHHHQDHDGGMAAVIREFQPRVFLASGSSYTTPHARAGRGRAGDKGTPATQTPARPRRIELGLGGPVGAGLVATTKLVRGAAEYAMELRNRGVISDANDQFR